MEEKVIKAIQDDYPDDLAWCYGCGRLNEQGHHLRTGWLGEKTITMYTPRPEYTGGIPGFVYGGLLASFIDCHSAGSASLYLHRKNGNEIGDGVNPPRFVTSSLQVNYKQPTPMGGPLKAIGIIEEIHPKKYKVYTEVFADDQLVVTGEVIVVLMPKTFRKEE
ncbi:PaaI family thioesterase [Lysinibacillus sp. LZ02]|uniref:PaaI family thioesterase n=1 Tax=Lysinibacillus sp. LZ02 TaxID=3420668 RepID=UPI003D367F07